MQTLPDALSPGHVVVCRGRAWRVQRTSDGVAFDLEAASRDGQVDAVRLLSPPDVLLALPRRTRRQSPRAWAHALRSLVVRAPDDDACLAAGRSSVTPLAAQWVPMLALLSGRVRRVLLADDVGMGKTVQAGLVLREIHDRMAAARTLVVVPATLVTQWRRELAERFAVHATVLSSNLLGARTQDDADDDAVLPGETCIVSMDTVRQPEVTTLLARCAWQLLVVDEAHLLAPGTARRDAVSVLAARASRLLLLTATPFTGRERDDRLLLTTGRHAGEHDRILIVARPSRSMGRPPVRQRHRTLTPAADEARVHRYLDDYLARASRESAVDGAGRLAAHLLWRRACSSMHALDTSVRRRIDVLGQPAMERGEQLALPLADEQDADDEWLRTPAWNDTDAERAALRAIAAATRACAGPGCKLTWLVHRVRRCREPVLIFTEYADTLRAVRQRLCAWRRVTCLYGAQTDDQRHWSIERFCTGGADVLVATDAAAEGLNLHYRCRLVVHLDVPWSPRRLAQRNGRLDRLGQRQQVRSTVLVAQGTPDERRVSVLEQRQILVEHAGHSGIADVAIMASARRERVAAHAMAAGAAAMAVPPPCGGDASYARIPARRGRRVALRSGLCRGESAIVLACVAVTGLHPLVRSSRWLPYGVPCGATWTPDTPGIASSDLMRLETVRRFATRARRRSARLNAHDTQAVASGLELGSHDLFGARGLFGERGTLTDSRAVDPPSGAGDARVHLLALRVLAWPR